MWADVDGLSLVDRINPAENCVSLADSRVVDRIEENVRNDLSVDGTIYGISFKGPKFWLYYYNKDIFAQYNLTPPTNYEEVPCNLPDAL